MKSSKEILDVFGKKVIENIYDDGIHYFNQITTNTTKWGAGKEYSDIFSKLNKEDKILATKYISEVLSTSIFAFLKIFEEHPEYKIIYEEDGQQVDLNKISEMLKAELLIENGWIQRFSKELKNESPA